MTARRALGLLLTAITAAAVLQAAGSALPVPPVGEPARLGEWWTDNGPAAAVLTVARLGGLAFCCYLALIGLLGAVAAVTRWRWTLALTMWAATPALRRAFAGGSLALALASGSAASAAAAPSAYSVTDLGAVQGFQPEPVHLASDGRSQSAASPMHYSVTDLGASPGPADHRVVVDINTAPTARARYALTDLGPAPSGPGSLQSDQAPRPSAHETAGADDTPEDTARETSRPDDRAKGSITGGSTSEATPGEGGQRTWLVEPGDHLWDIAAATVAERSGSDDRMSIVRYWLKLIEANVHMVGDDPDLIQPGLVVVLPD